MQKLISKLYHKFRHLILYGIIGSCSVCVDFCVFTLLTTLTPLHYLIANCISVTCGLTNSYWLNSKYNFKVANNHARRAAMFYTVGFACLALSNLLLWLFYQEAGLPQPVAKLLAIVLGVIVQFTVNSLVTFREKAGEK
jgi:putative flippase GtrA